MIDSARPTASQPLQQTREAVLRYQQRSLEELLRYVWRHSSFYRDYYASHGIAEKDLAEITVGDLPLLSKQVLMENFDAAVTDLALKKNELQQWIMDNPDPDKDFRKDFIVIRSSGSSGIIGIFVYDQKAWRIANTTMASRLPMPENYPSGKTRAAFFLTSEGHPGGVSTAARMPRAVYDTLILSLLDSTERIARQLNAFQPHRLHGYSSTISMLAEMAIQGKLRIHPKTILVSGDKLTDSMERKIRDAWNASIYLLYSSAESKYIAFKETAQDQMMVIDDLNIIEVLNENNNTVLPGGEGRVVLTNLYNYALPILRYELGDYAVLGRAQSNSPFTTIQEIKGRVSDALTVVMQDGRYDTIYPATLRGVFAPGLIKVQFVSRQPGQVQIDYIATHNMDAAVRQEFQRILDLKGASRTTFEVRQVKDIANDPQTGKLRLVKIEHDQVHDSSERTLNVRLEQRAGRISPTNPFVRFEKEETEQSVPYRFEQIIGNYPERTAVKTQKAALSYDALNRTANRVARTILAQGGKREQPIALLLDHDAPMVAGILGVLKAGKICVPLDPSYPQARASYILEDSQTELMVTNNKNLSMASKLAQHVHQLINLDEIDVNLSTENLELSISPDTLAYILYTSGSTGKPKGVIHNHRNVLHNAMRYSNGCHICPEDRVTLLASLGTGQGTPTAFSALLNGASLYPFNIREEGVASLGTWLKTEEITVYISSPTVFRHFIGTLTGEERFPKLRLIRLGSEQIRKSDVALYKKHFSPRCIFAIFLSATETGNFSQYFIDKETQVTGDTVPVGYAVDDMEILLLDDSGEEVGFNRVGEIAVKSRYLSPGYWRQPELTRAAFLPDPAGGDRRIYRTGDMGRVLPDGCLEHLGRKDFQVKIRGHRVEIAEVELALLKHNQVKETAVVALENQAGDTELVAYVVPASYPAPTLTELRSFLNEKMPDHMVPSAFVLMEALPLTPVGKVDLRALPAPGRGRPEMEVAFVASRTVTEGTLAEIWQEVLQVEKVGIHDNFSDLGGHSLLAVRLINEIQKTFDKKLPIAAIFQAPTVEQLAKLISQEMPSNSRPSLVPLQPKGSQRPFFCVHELFGDIVCYMNLARHLGEDQPFYALQARGLDGAGEPSSSIEVMAAYYIEELRAVQPQGPYALGGLCFGGIVAFEMAQQLRRKGEAVALVALLDSPAGIFRHGKLTRWWSFLRNIPSDLPSWVIGCTQLSRAQWRDLIKIRWAKARLAVRSRSSVADSNKNYPPKLIQVMGDVFEFSEQHRKVARAQSRALREYRPQIYPGRLTLFRARMQPFFSSHDRANDWGRLAGGGVDVRVVPGNHLAMLQEPHVQVLAEQLRDSLDRARAGGGS